MDDRNREIHFALASTHLTRSGGSHRKEAGFSGCSGSQVGISRARDKCRETVGTRGRLTRDENVNAHAQEALLQTFRMRTAKNGIGRCMGCGDRSTLMNHGATAASAPGVGESSAGRV